LYEGSTCKVSDTDYQELATVTSVDGLVVYSPDLLLFAVGYFDGGFMEWEVTPGVIEKRSIRFHVDDHIELTSPIIDLSGGVEIKLFPGCDHVMEGDCTIKFNNRPNFGGMPDIPKLNPFGSNSVFK
jgi:uncharacterized phage protein (TIGR02218 family)